MATLLPSVVAAGVAAVLANLHALGAAGNGAAGAAPMQPTGPYLALTAAGAAAFAACESNDLRAFLATTNIGGFFAWEQVLVPQAGFALYAPPPDHPHMCGSHDAGVAGAVCSHFAGLYEPMNLCVLCSTCQCIFGGGGQPFGANDHSAANALLSIAGYIITANGISGETGLVGAPFFRQSRAPYRSHALARTCLLSQNA